MYLKGEKRPVSGMTARSQSQVLLNNAVSYEFDMEENFKTQQPTHGASLQTPGLKPAVRLGESTWSAANGDITRNSLLDDEDTNPLLEDIIIDPCEENVDQ